MEKVRIIVDPRSSYAYSSFYLYGLAQKYGSHAISYSMKPFVSLPEPGWNLRFVIDKDGKRTKVFIHTSDSYRVITKEYEWCDIYGNVNANFQHCTKEQYPKQISLVPSFAVRAMSTNKALMMAFSTYLKAAKSIVRRTEWNKVKDCMEVNPVKNTKHHFGRIYKTSINRLPYWEYEAKEHSMDDYVFFLSTLWYDHPDNKNDEGVNLRRANFINACKSFSNIHFEGGLLADASSSREKFIDVVTDIRVPIAEWIKKTKQSAFVFNTPAFWDCHGWKLGEYLALGKCIISTPLSNDLPAPLVHGVHIHYVEPTQESMKEAIDYILSHPEYRLKLEQGAKKYWEEYGTPLKSLDLLGI